MSNEETPEEQPEQVAQSSQVEEIHAVIKTLVKNYDLDFGTFVFYIGNQIHTMHVDDNLMKFEGEDITQLPYPSFMGFMIMKELREIMTKLDKALNTEEKTEENPDE